VKLKAMGSAADASASGDTLIAPVVPDVAQTAAADRSREQLMKRRLSELRAMQRKEREGVAGGFDDAIEPHGDGEDVQDDGGEALAVGEAEPAVKDEPVAKEEPIAKVEPAKDESVQDEGVDELILDDGEGVEELVLEEFDSTLSLEGSGYEGTVDDSMAEAGSDDFILLDEPIPAEESMAPKAGASTVAAPIAAQPKPETVVVAPVPVPVSMTKPVPVTKPAVAAEAPVVVASTLKQVAKPAANPESVDRPKPEQASEPAVELAKADALGLYGQDWVLARKPNHYTIQLLGSRTRREAETFVKKNTLTEPVAVVESRRRGKQWFSLFYGDYRNYSKAKAALKTLSKGLSRHGPWIRKYKKIQKSLGGKR
jgi:hypothetical protein